MNTVSCSKDITKEWVKFVVEEYLKKQLCDPIPNVRIKDFSTGKGSGVGNSFNSDIIRLDITASQTEDDAAETVSSDIEYHYIIKFLSNDLINREFNRLKQSDINELILYSELIPCLNKFQASHIKGEKEIHIPEFVYGKHTAKEFVLVMKNAKYDGYETIDKFKGLDFPHLKESVLQLARIHALSYALNKSEPLLKRHPSIKLLEECHKPYYATFMPIFFYFAIDFLHAKKDTEELANKIKACERKLRDEFESMGNEQPGVPQCLMHGDFWSNNLMFRTKENEENPEEDPNSIQCMVIDWGNMMWGSPVLDLQYFLYSSTELETRKEHLETILKVYHSAFTDITNKVGTPVPDWTYDEFFQEWNRVSIDGFFMGIGLNTFTLSHSNPLSNPQASPVGYRILNSIMQLVMRVMPTSFMNYYKSMVTTKEGRDKIISQSMGSYGLVRNELLSGNNKILSKRILDLSQEADERGLFNE